MKYLRLNITVKNENKDLIMGLQEIRPNPTDDEVSQILDLNSCYVHLFENNDGHIRYIETAKGGGIFDKAHFNKMTKKFKNDPRIIEFKKTAVTSFNEIIDGMLAYSFNDDNVKVNSCSEISQQEVNEKFGAIVNFQIVN